jgi:hypothetical protein
MLKIAIPPNSNWVGRAEGCNGALYTVNLVESDYALVVSGEAPPTEWLEQCVSRKIEVFSNDQLTIPFIQLPIPTNERSAFGKAANAILRHVKRKPILEQSKRLAMSVHVKGGMGDMVVAYPTLKALHRAGKMLFASCTMEYKRREMLLMSPYVEGIDSGSNYECFIEYNLVDLKRPRQYQYAGNAGVKIESTQVEFRLEKEIVDRYRKWHDQFERKVVIVACDAAIHAKSLRPETIKALAVTLAQIHEVAILHSARTLGDSPHVHDLGGLISIKEMVHLISVCDGAVCADSGIAHVACGLRLPTVVMHSAGGIDNHIQYALYYPDAEKKHVMELCKRLHCQPCWPDYSCGQDRYAKCMEFSAAELADNLKTVMEDTRDNSHSTELRVGCEDTVA